MRHVNIHVKAIHEAQIINEVSIQHIPRTSNPADLFCTLLGSYSVLSMVTVMQVGA